METANPKLSAALFGEKALTYGNLLKIKIELVIDGHFVTAWASNSLSLLERKLPVADFNNAGRSMLLLEFKKTFYYVQEYFCEDELANKT